MRKLNAPLRAPDLEFEVDREHGGVRLLGCLTFLFSSVASYFILGTIVSSSGLIVVGAALAIAVGMTYLADFLSKTILAPATALSSSPATSSSWSKATRCKGRD